MKASIREQSEAVANSVKYLSELTPEQRREEIKKMLATDKKRYKKKQALKRPEVSNPNLKACELGSSS